MSNPNIKRINVLEVKFVADEDVQRHISENAGLKVRKLSDPHTLEIKQWMKNLENSSNDEAQDIFKEQDYVTALVVQESMRNGSSASGSDVFPFQTPKHSNRMAERGMYCVSFSELIQNSAKNTKQNSLKKPEEKTNTPKISSKCSSSKDQEDNNLVEEYFEAHSSSKVLTSDRTLQKLEKKKLDQESLQNLLNNVPVAFAAEREKLMKQYESLFYKWMLQLHLGFNIVLYGLGSKRDLLENFRVSLLQDSVHLVVNGFFPNISIKSILNSITEEVLNHMGTFRSPQDQVDFILKSFKEGKLYGPSFYKNASPSLSPKNQMMWDQAKQSMYNWLWYEMTTFSPYAEETAYENSLLVQHSGSLALSSLTHVLCSLTSNARGIFRLLVEYQLENKDNPSYLGLSFQDLYQRCREAFLVNSDLTLRAQLTEFRDHKLIRTKRGADGVEYLLIPMDAGILVDFLQKDIDV
ncbi:putative Origin recognition complex subunit 2-like protein [Naja naja]|nr:putative Origin recognition complex subunit 2-like protein [Naja naja]